MLGILIKKTRKLVALIAGKKTEELLWNSTQKKIPEGHYDFPKSL